MKRKALFGGVILIFLIGIVSGGFVPLFGFVVGGVSVGDPVFYLDGSQVLFGEETVYRYLSLNLPPDEETETIIFNGNRKVFVSDGFEMEGFYSSRFDIVLWAKTNEAGNILQFEVVRVLEGNLEEDIICEPLIIEVSAVGNFDRYETSCFSNGEIEFNEGDRFGVVIFGAGGDSVYWLNTGEEFDDGFSRMEIHYSEETALMQLPENEEINRKKSGGGGGGSGSLDSSLSDVEDSGGEFGNGESDFEVLGYEVDSDEGIIEEDVNYSDVIDNDEGQDDGGSDGGEQGEETIDSGNDQSDEGGDENVQLGG